MVLGQQVQPDEPTAQLADMSLCTGYAPIANLPAEEAAMLYNSGGNQALLNSQKIVFDTTNVVGDVLADSFLLADTSARVLAYGDRDGSSPLTISSDADVSVPQFGIGGGILPQADGYSSQADANSTAFGDFYMGRVLQHYFASQTFAGGPASLYVGLFGGQLEDYASPPVAPTSPLAEARQPIAQNFDLTTLGTQVTATYNAELRWPATAGGTVKSVGIFDALSGGNLVAMTSVSDLVVTAGNDIYIPSGSLVLRIN
ncbi:MAG: hypothetical protein GY753_02130 [Gammaproteobacteria bacterium]|nr:hypothetical protein [Gammaproteobacteria bacterium]